MSQIKFKQLINDFSPTSLLDVFKTHDFFLAEQARLSKYDSKLFSTFEQLGIFGSEHMEDKTNVIVVCSRVLSPLNERSGRRGQYDIAKKILKDNPKYNAGIFVYYDSKGDFRMSLIYAEYLGTKIKFNTFRRFTYFVSKGQSNNTFIQQVAPFNFINLKELKELFSVDKVTKEFFEKYHDLFIETLEDFDKNTEFQDIVVKTNTSTTPDFVKKLMGQIVFLYFVQKKGWLGVRKDDKWGSGDSAFLRNLYTSCIESKRNYFNDYLEPLFYKALAEKNVDDFFEPFNCKIPFLNGGLFESIYDWQNTKINIPNDTIGKLLDFFDQYNFTVDENTPSDQEISVDPEMLGKIFENLLNVKDRKDKGAFYTPREIVHYMCQESLIQHLVSENVAPESRIRKIFEVKDTDLSVSIKNEENTEKVKRLADLKQIASNTNLSLKNIKIVDPAVGSGAFPMGMLNEISSVRYFLNTNFLHEINEIGKELSLYNIKKETLENCIYAVDIDPGAVEIAKLRFWLSLIVEYESDDSSIDPPTLPNLDYKIMQGNSLLEEYEGVKLFDEKLLQSSIVNSDILRPENTLITTLQSELMKLCVKNPDWAKKGTLNKPDDVIELETRLRELLKQSKKIEKGSVDQKDLFTSVAESRLIWDEIKSKHKQFFSESQREEKVNLRRQIDNLNWQLIESTLKERKNDLALEKLDKLKHANTKPFFLWHLYFAEVFEENGGFDIVIGNPPYVRQEEIDYKQALQEDYDVYNAVSDLYTYFYERGFRLLRDSGTLAFITSNKFLRARYGIFLRNYLKDNTDIKEIINFGEEHMFEAITNTLILVASRQKHLNNLFSYSKHLDRTDKILFSQDELQEGEWTIDNPDIIHLKNKLEQQGTLLGNWDVQINRGILTGYNEAFILDKITMDKIVSEDPKSRDIIRPIIRGRDIKRYHFIDSGFFLLVTHNGYRTANEEVIEAIDISKYPAVKNHLDNYIKQLKERQDKGNTVYNLRDCAFMDDFSKEKIIWIELTNKNKFAYSEKEDYLLAGAFFLVGKSLKYLLAFLNSKLCLFYFSLICNSSGMATTQWKKFALEKVPIKELPWEDQRPFIEIVDQILNITGSSDYATHLDKQEKVKMLEDKIDKLIYELYSLTPEEVKIIENQCVG